MFVPWKTERSMVVEVKCDDGTWNALAIDRLPAQLGDEIKKHRVAFHMAAKNLTPDEVNDLIPISFPITHNVEGFAGVAQCTLEEWDEMGCP